MAGGSWRAERRWFRRRHVAKGIGQQLALAELHAAVPALARQGNITIHGAASEDANFSLRVRDGLRGRFTTKAGLTSRAPLLSRRRSPQTLDERRDGVDRFGSHDIGRDPPPLPMREQFVDKLLGRADERVGSREDMFGREAWHQASQSSGGCLTVVGDLDVLYERIERYGPAQSRPTHQVEAFSDRLGAPVGVVMMAVFECPAQPGETDSVRARSGEFKKARAVPPDEQRHTSYGPRGQEERFVEVQMVAGECHHFVGE